MVAVVSACSSFWNLLPTSIVTCTGVGLWLGTTVMPVTLPTVTPSSVTGAPFFKPAALPKYDRSTIFLAKMPPVARDMRKIRDISTAEATRNRTPTLSCDHWISLRLGTSLLLQKLTPVDAYSKPGALHPEATTPGVEAAHRERRPCRSAQGN